MQKHIAVIGASVGGLVAAAQLHEQGFKVTVVEKGPKVGGLFNKIQTPFGTQELGMHVLYVKDDHYRHLSSIFGEQAFDILTGTSVDIGASNNFGKTTFSSVYPDLQQHPLQTAILQEIVDAKGSNSTVSNAEQEICRRFGETACREVVAPALEKLWKQPAKELTKDAIHCFFDLRRVVACNKQQADKLKKDPWLDRVLANPDQLSPSGVIFDGRKGLVVRNAPAADLSSKALQWAETNGIALVLGASVKVEHGVISINDASLAENFDAAIVSMPVHSLVQDSMQKADSLELSIYYLQVKDRVGDKFPSYYILCHDTSYQSSRIVNYDGYNPIDPAVENSVLTVEVVHEKGCPPEAQTIVTEVCQALPGIEIQEHYQLERTLSVYSPTLKNASILDSLTENIRGSQEVPLYFTGMRTDRGVFFSHHTIGLAYDAALDCMRQLA